MSLDVAREFFTRVNRTPTVAACADADCSRSVHARGMCSMHYQRWWRSNRS